MSIRVKYIRLKASCVDYTWRKVVDRMHETITIHSNILFGTWTISCIQMFKILVTIAHRYSS